MVVFAILLLTYILTVGRCVSGDIGYGLCSEVYQMHQYCTQASSDVVSPPLVEVGVAVGDRVGKQGPRGLPGRAATVNYTVIDRKITAMFQEAEERIDATLTRYEKILNETQDKISNAAVVKIEEIESKMEAKLIEYEIFLNESLQSMISKSFPTDCGNVSHQYAKVWDAKGGVFDIYPESRLNSVEVYCDLTTAGGKWTVFQRRIDGSVDFHRDWDDYVNGFGYRDKEFWLGLEKIYQLTKNGNYELRVDLEDWEGNVAYAQYGIFVLSGSSDKYRITVGNYTGDAGDSMAYGNNYQFSTRDADHDRWSSNCAENKKGPWWYNLCSDSNLNGLYYQGGKYRSTIPDGIIWCHWKRDKYYSMKFSEMKFRKID